MTPEEALNAIKDEAAIDHLGQCQFNDLLFSETEKAIIDEIAKRYAKYALEKAAENARIRMELKLADGTTEIYSEKWWSRKYRFYQVDKSSITDIEL